jgi:hypothetical protein
MEWVVRAGVATAQRLIEGYAQHKGAPGLYGFSVQYAPGATVEQLAQAGRFPHAQISYATDDALQAALAPLGYTMRLVKSPGSGYHHTFAVLYDGGGTMAQVLPPDAAQAISQAFQQRANPARIR